MMLPADSALQLVLVFVVILAIGGLVVLGIVMLAFRKQASWKLYWTSVAGAFGLLVLNTVWNIVTA
jgi:hypothetical protein